ncbi:AP2/ERF domain - like 10 [Theobroma cacao]|nr:AP2/ERF domain - like 10 [Theobroma cacao]
MGKLSLQNQKNNAQNNNFNNTTSNGVTKVKRTRRSVPRDSPPQRSSIYRGVTRQVFLTEEETYYFTINNTQLSTYQKELKEMEDQSREEYIGSLRRKSSGFSRGVSKYRGVARHHHNGRWEARIGRVFGNKYLYLGTYATQEEAATAYDMAAIEYRGLNAVTNFDLSRYIKWLKPNQTNTESNPNPKIESTSTVTTSPTQELNLNFVNNNQLQASNPSDQSLLTQPRPANATSALGLLLQSSKFKEMMEMTSAADHCQLTPAVSEPVPCSFPEDIQTYFGCQDSSSYGDVDDIIFGELNSFMPPMFQCDFDA